MKLEPGRDRTALLVEHRGVERGIEPGVPIFSERGHRPSRQPVGERIVSTAGPFRRREVIPTGGFGDERAFNFIATGDQARAVLLGRQDALIEQGLVNSIGKQGAVIRMTLLKEHGKEAPGSIARQTTGRAARGAIPGRAIIRTAEPAVGVVEIKFEAAA